MDNNIIFTYLACIIILFIIGRVFIVPLRIIMKLIINSILGAFLIYVINFIGATFEFHIGLNIFTTIFIGILGIPRQYMFNNNKIVNRIKYLTNSIN